jgi:hypothetical protein
LIESGRIRAAAALIRLLMLRTQLHCHQCRVQIAAGRADHLADGNDHTAAEIIRIRMIEV